MEREKTRGFTLMEVLIAMAILAIALVAVFRSQSQSISMATESRFLTTAALLAESKMAEAETSSSLYNHVENGDFGSDYPEYVWRLEIGDTQLPQFKKIKVTVTNKLFTRRGTYELLLYKKAGM